VEAVRSVSLCWPSDYTTTALTIMARREIWRGYWRIASRFYLYNENTYK